LRAKGSSPLAAQIAYEWQRKGRLMPALTMGFVAFGTFFYVVFADYSVPQNRAAALGFSMMLFPVYAMPVGATIAGMLALLDDYRHRVSGAGTFLFTRAADSGLHSRARLLMSLKAVATTIGCCLPVMGIGVVLVAHSRPESFRELFLEPAPVSLGAAVLWAAGYLLLLWTLYWMAIPGVIFWFWFVLVAVGFELFDGGAHAFFESIVLWPPSLAMIAATFWVVWRTARDKMLFPWTAAFAMATATAAWFLIAWMGIAGSGLEAMESHFGIVTVLAAVWALSLCPAFPILAQPMLVERLRRS